MSEHSPSAPPCPACGTQNPPGARFCRGCGAALATGGAGEPTQAGTPPDSTSPAGVCPECRHVNPLESRFCRRCGTSLPVMAIEPTAAPEPPTQPELVTHRMDVPRAPLAPSAARATSSDQPSPKRGWALPLAVIAVLVLGGGVGAAAVLLTSKSSSGRHHGGTTITSPGTGSIPTTTTPTGTTTPCEANGNLPCESSEQMQASIQHMLYTWHEDIVNGNYSAAWALLSERKRQQDEQKEGYATWEHNQASLKPYLNPSGIKVSIVNTNAGAGEATVDVKGMTWDQPGAHCSEWSGITWVLYENGSWRYDPGYSTTAAREAEYKSRYTELLGGSC